MKRLFITLLLAFLSAATAFSQIPGIWQNSGRFVEFSADGRMRIVLKPYYGFVYQDTGWRSCTVSAVAADAVAAPDTIGASSSASFPPAVPGLFNLTIRYAGEKKDCLVPVALIRDSLYFRFYRKLALPVAAASGDAVTVDSVPSTGSVSSRTHPVTLTAASGANPSAEAGGPLDGFWQAAGNADALRLYRSEPVDEFYCFYFLGNTYYRIRYWAADVRFKDIAAEFTAVSGEKLTVPKFIPMDGVLYTCITSTGKILRNYENGTFALKDGALLFKPENVVFSGTAAAVAKPLRYAFSEDGSVLALGSPYLVRSKVADLDAEIASHNALRRPPRKPIFDFMKLDFHWDEIERIRNGNKSAK